MSFSENIRFGASNQIPRADLSATPAPNTDLDNVKSEWEGPIARWAVPATEIVVQGVLPDQQVGEYLAIPGSNLVGLAELQVELFEDDAFSRRSLLIPYAPLSALPAAGTEFRAGIDPWATPIDEDLPSIFLRWFSATLYRSFKIYIRHSPIALEQANDIRIRHLMIGTSVRVDHNFSYGHQLQIGGEPSLVQTDTGSLIESRGEIGGRRFTFSLDLMSESDRQAIVRFRRGLKGRPFAFSAFPERLGAPYSDYSFLGRFITPSLVIHRFDRIHQIRDMTIGEV